MLRALLAVLTLWSFSSSLLFGQFDLYDPYAKVKEEPPIREDGTIVWPTFFRDAAMEAKYQQMFRDGSCTGTRQATVAMLNGNKVDVNKLPASTMSARVVAMRNGLLAAVDAQGKSVMIALHPRGVTRVDVLGDIPATQLTKGLSVRFTTKVDAEGHGVEPLDMIEVYTRGPKDKPREVQADRVQAIEGEITQVHQNRIQIRVNAGKLRGLKFELAETARVVVDAHSPQLIGQGDELKVVGHEYAGEGSVASRTIFADSIIATKPTAVDSASREVASK